MKVYCKKKDSIMISTIVSLHTKNPDTWNFETKRRQKHHTPEWIEFLWCSNRRFFRNKRKTEKCIELNKKLIDSLPIEDLEIAACEGRIKELNKMKKDVEKRIEERNQPMITAVLSNGLVVRVPMKDYKETLAKMEKNIKEANKNKIGS